VGAPGYSRNVQLRGFAGRGLESGTITQAFHLRFDFEHRLRGQKLLALQ
jgi:hypothetical protein